MQGCSFDGIRFRRCGNCSLEIFCSRRRERGALCSPTPPRVTGARGFTPSRALPGLVWRGFGFPMMQAVFLRIWFPKTRAWGAPLPCTPSGDGCERVITLSRSPGVRLAGSLVSDGAGNCSGLEDLISDGAELFGRGFWFPTERGTVLIGGFDFQRSGGYSFDGFCFRRRGRGALRSPAPPRATGCERVVTLSRSPGDELEGSLVSDGARDLLFDGTGATLLRAFASGDAGVGRSAPLHPLR